MSSVKVFVGLDYHQASVQVCVMDTEGKILTNKSVANDVAVIIAAAVRHGQVQAAAIEACCGAANLAEELCQQGWSVSLAHPGYVRRMKPGSDKTDSADARVLADLLRVGYLPKVWLAPDCLRQLRRLVRYRQQLVNQRRDIKLRIRSLLRDVRQKDPELSRPWTKSWMKWLSIVELSDSDRWIMHEHCEMLTLLSQKIQQIEQQLETMVADDAVVRKLMEQPGVGLITAVTLRAEIGQFDRFQTGKQLSRYCGVTPRNASSGERIADAGLVSAGNPQLRGVLVELAHRLIRYEPRWGQMCGRMLGQGKKKNVIVAAVANRWVRWLYHQMQPANLAV